MKQVLLQPAYVLHRRPYRETSFLVELFTPDYGRISVIAKGARQKRSTMQGLLQAFTPLLISWLGKNELMTLTAVEAQRVSVRLQGQCLFAGFYLNELLICLLEKWDAHPMLYQIYEKTLLALQAKTLAQPILRSFEKQLLEELGYGLLPKHTTALHETIIADQYYRFVPEQGLLPAGPSHPEHPHIFSGKSLLALANEDWQDDKSLQDAKRLIRLALLPLLRSRPLHSRKLFTLITENHS